MNQKKDTHFGYETITKKEKGKKQIKKEEKVILLEEIKETKLVIKF